MKKNTKVPGQSGDAGLIPTWAGLSRVQQDFVRSVATGSGDCVRASYGRLPEDQAAVLRRVDEFDALIRAINDELNWSKEHPEESVDHVLYRRSVPELKALRAVTAAAMRRGAKWARNALASVPKPEKPINKSGLHYRTAHAVADYLSPVVGLAGIVLFGSVTRGDERPDSDVDLMLIGTRDVPLTQLLDLVSVKLEPIITECITQEMRVRLRPDVLGITEAPEVHLMLKGSFPSKWENEGLDSGSVHVLWKLESSSDLLARRARTSPLAARTLESGAIVLHQRFASKVVRDEELAYLYRYDHEVRAAADLELLRDGHLHVFETHATIGIWSRGSRLERQLLIDWGKESVNGVSREDKSVVFDLTNEWLNTLQDMLELHL